MQTAAAVVKDVRFERANGFDRVVVSLSAMPSYSLVPAPNGKMRLEMKSLAAWTDNVEAVLESLQLPVLRRERVPAPLAGSR